MSRLYVRRGRLCVSVRLAVQLNEQMFILPEMPLTENPYHVRQIDIDLSEMMSRINHIANLRVDLLLGAVGKLIDILAYRPHHVREHRCQRLQVLEQRPNGPFFRVWGACT